MTYLRQHWRGDLSLPVSFWVNGLLGWLALNAVAVLVLAPIPGSIYPGLPLIFAFVTWQGVGIWRAAGKQQVRGGSRVLRILARVVVLLIVYFTALDLWHLLGASQLRSL